MYSVVCVCVFLNSASLFWILVFLGIRHKSMAMESSSPEAMIEEDDDDTQQCHQQHSPGFTSGPGPSAINCSKFGPGIKIDKETLSVSYSGKGQHQNDVGAVQVGDRIRSDRIQL